MCGGGCGSAGQLETGLGQLVRRRDRTDGDDGDEEEEEEEDEGGGGGGRRTCKKERQKGGAKGRGGANGVYISSVADCCKSHTHTHTFTHPHTHTLTHTHSRTHARISYGSGTDLIRTGNGFW